MTLCRLLLILHSLHDVPLALLQPVWTVCMAFQYLLCFASLFD